MVEKENKLITMAWESKKNWNLVFILLAPAILIVASGYLSVFLFKIISLYILSNNIIGLFIPHVVSIFLIFLLVKFIEKRDFSTLGFRTNNFFLKYLKGLGIGIILVSITVIIMKAINVIDIEINKIRVNDVLNIGIYFLMFMIQGAGEEIYLRGWQMPLLGKKWGLPLAIIVNSLFFSLLHLLNPSFTLIPFINIVIVGILFSIYAFNEESIVGACGIHSSWNWMIGSIFGFEVSGMKLGESSLFGIRIKGSEIFTGGGFGPEGSIIVTIVLLVFTLIIWNKFRKLNRI